MEKKDKPPKGRPPLPPKSAKVSQLPTQAQGDTTSLQNLPRTTEDPAPSAAPTTIQDETSSRTTQSPKKRDPASSVGCSTPPKIRKIIPKTFKSQEENAALSHTPERLLETSVQRFLGTAPGTQSLKESTESVEEQSSSPSTSSEVVKMKELHLVSGDSSTMEGVSTFDSASVPSGGDCAEIMASDDQSATNTPGTSQPGARKLSLEKNIKHPALDRSQSFPLLPPDTPLDRSQSFPLMKQDAPPKFFPIGYSEHKKHAATPSATSSSSHSSSSKNNTSTSATHAQAEIISLNPSAISSSVGGSSLEYEPPMSQTEESGIGTGSSIDSAVDNCGASQPTGKPIPKQQRVLSEGAVKPIEVHLLSDRPQSFPQMKQDTVEGLFTLKHCNLPGTLNEGKGTQKSNLTSSDPTNIEEPRKLPKPDPEQSSDESD